MAIATHPASAVADDELARHLDAGLRDLTRLTEMADRCSPDALWAAALREAGHDDVAAALEG